MTDPLTCKIKMSYKNEKMMKKQYGKGLGRQIAFGRCLAKMLKSLYGKGEK